MKNISFLLFAFLLLVFQPVSAQDLESENGFKYMKAKYLLETDRFEEAIKELNKIIQNTPSYEDVLILRAEAKLALAAYRGSKQDIMTFIESNGITERAVNILAKSDYELGNADAALNSLAVAVSLQPEADHYVMMADIYTKRDEMLKACDAWDKAAELGSREGREMSAKVCGNNRFNDVASEKTERVENTDTEPVKNYPPRTTEEDDGPISIGKRVEDPEDSDDPTYTGSDNSNDDTEYTMEEEAPKKEVINIIKVDEDLSLEIYGDGLGERRILDQPSILIISETDGDVAVDICVNRNGKVESADYNSRESTISKSSLVSLAIRKAKEFWFQRTTDREMCGVIKFKIKGS